MQERVMAFIDGSNLYWGSRNRGFKIDHTKLLDALIGKDRMLMRPYYYCGIGVPPSKPQVAFQDMLQFSGFEVIAKPLRKRDYTVTEHGTGRKVRGERWGEKGVDVALVTDMLSMGYKNAYDTAILVGGDEDYLSAVRDIKAIPKRIEVAAFSDKDTGNPPKFMSTINREMRKVADVFYPLQDLKNKIKLVKKSR